MTPRRHGVLFLCAGSMATRVHQDAVAVMAERGIDISVVASKSVDAIDPEGVDLVITLCADEVCPNWPGRIERMHWPLRDPAAASGADRLQRFKDTRDDIERRLVQLGRDEAWLES